MEPHPPLLRWSGLTHPGRIRKNNEDAFLALAFDAREVRYLGKIGEASLLGQDFVFAVSDGMGGANAGEFASRIAVEKITRLLPRSFRHSAEGMVAGFHDVLAEVFHQTHHALTALGKSYEECSGMGATLTLAWFTPGWVYFGHVGDSRLYHLPKQGGLRQVSHDDTYAGYQFRQGLINERELRNHPRRNILSKALGGGHQFVDPQVGAIGWEPGDRFLLCSDGLTDGLWNRALEEHLRTPPTENDPRSPAAKMVEESVSDSGRDNTTAVVVECAEN